MCNGFTSLRSLELSNSANKILEDPIFFEIEHYSSTLFTNNYLFFRLRIRTSTFLLQNKNSTTKNDIFECSGAYLCFVLNSVIFLYQSQCHTTLYLASIKEHGVAWHLMWQSPRSASEHSHSLAGPKAPLIGHDGRLRMSSTLHHLHMQMSIEATQW